MSKSQSTQSEILSELRKAQQEKGSTRIAGILCRDIEKLIGEQNIEILRLRERITHLFRAVEDRQ